ncbi:MAG: methyltransferase domain-containing protein [Acidobacteriota bacterium]|nr:methyltransferase domain-containing protein [Acidobacteriota bacterium]
MNLLVPRRQPSREILDDPEIPSEEMSRSLEDLSLVHRWWGSAGAIERFLVGEIRRLEISKPVLLDVGAGSGDVTRRLARALALAGHPATVLACDLQWRHLAAGRRMAGDSFPSISADAFTLPLAEKSVDWIVSTLFFHHFSPAENADLLASFSRAARHGFALLDLRRHVLPLAFISVAGRLLFKTRVSVLDGIASVRQAYTPEEAARIARDAVSGARVERVFPFRFLLSAPKGFGAQPPLAPTA